MVDGQVEAEVAVGDFVEAVFVADQSIKRRGVVIKVLSQKSVIVKGWDFESLCDNPQIIDGRELSTKDRDLLNWVLKKIE